METSAIFFNSSKPGEPTLSTRWRFARRAGNKKRFFEDPDWAKVVLMRMGERGILESDSQGRYRIKPVSRKDKNKRWVAPDIAKILHESGVEVEAGGDIASDEYYEEL